MNLEAQEQAAKAATTAIHLLNFNAFAFQWRRCHHFDGIKLKPFLDTRHLYATGADRLSAEDDLSALTSNSGTTLASTCLSMSWVILVIAAVFEIAWAVGLKFTEGFSRPWPTLGTLAALVISVSLLGIAAKSLPIGTAYAVWTGIGAVGTVLCGIAFLGDPATPGRIVCLGFIIIGILGLKIFS